MAQTAPSCQVAIIGTVGVGKSCFMTYFLKGKFESYDPTVSDIYRKQVEEPSILVEFLDVDSLQDFPVLFEHCIRVSDGIIMAFSITNRESFLVLPSFLESIANLREEKVPAVVLATQCDIEERRVVTVHEAFQFAAGNCLPYYESSSKFAVNVDNAVKDVLRQILVWFETRPRKVAYRSQTKKQCFIC